MSISLQADATLPQGYININGQTVATISTANGLSVPMANNTVSGGALVNGAVTQSKIAPNTVGMGPVFNAISNSLTTATNGQFTKVNLGLVRFDTNNFFSNSRYTPLIPGYYQINASVTYAVNGMTALLATLSKNPTTYGVSPNWTEVYYGNYGNFTGYTSNVCAVMFFNGVTDFVELSVYQNTGSAQNVGNGQLTHMNGFLVRGV